MNKKANKELKILAIEIFKLQSRDEIDELITTFFLIFRHFFNLKFSCV